MNPAWIKFTDLWPPDGFYWCCSLDSTVVAYKEATICRVSMQIIHFIGMGQFSRQANINSRFAYYSSKLIEPDLKWYAS